MQSSTYSNKDHQRQLVEENQRLNEEEYRQRKTVLASYPPVLFMQLDAPCNQDCVFCSRPSAYRHFDLDDFRKMYEEKLTAALERAQRINLTGSGELLLLPEAKRNLEYFNRFPFAEKMFATNGSSLTPKMIDAIAGSGNRYTIHVSLHAADQGRHAIMTCSDTFSIVRHNLEYLRTVKPQVRTMTVNFIFVATTKNIDNLEDFITFARESQADGVIVYYNYVYRMDQKKLSCYFDKGTTNRMLDAARQIADRTGMRVSLPPKFGQDVPVAEPGICGEAWSQMMINPEGDIITCDVAGDSRETIRDKSFMEAWNGAYYTRIRARLATEGKKACSALCFRANGAAVNDFRAHFITRGKSEKELSEFLAGT